MKNRTKTLLAFLLLFSLAVLIMWCSGEAPVNPEFGVEPSPSAPADSGADPPD
jgi:hypothetical protein